MFQAFPSSVETTLGVVRPPHPATIVIDVDSVVPEMSNAAVMVAEPLSTSSYLPYMTFSVPICKRGHSSTIAQSSKKRRLTSATATATEVLKEEGFLNITNAAESSHQSTESVTIQEALLEALRTLCCVYIEKF